MPIYGTFDILLTNDDARFACQMATLCFTSKIFGDITKEGMNTEGTNAIGLVGHNSRIQVNRVCT
jgi:hypothetical protein